MKWSSHCDHFEFQNVNAMYKVLKGKLAMMAVESAIASLALLVINVTNVLLNIMVFQSVKVLHKIGFQSKLH